MTRQGSVGPLRRLLRAFGGALKRGILGKSCHDYAGQFTGTDAYWDRMIAAQRGRLLQQPAEAANGRSSERGNGIPNTAPRAESLPPDPSDFEEEPVHGWTRRQLRAYLARNPAYRPTYELALRSHRGPPTR
jgi:hypothetical protein